MGNLNALLKLLGQDSDFQRIIEASCQLQRDKKTTGDLVIISSSSVRSYLISSLFSQVKTRALLVVTSGSRKARRLATDIANFLPAGSVEEFPDWGVFPHERISPSKQIVGKRLKVLNLLDAGERIIVVTSPQALLRKMPKPKYRFFESIELCHKGETDLDALLAGLVEFGYKNVALVEAQGEFSRRGGIVDVFPPEAPHPVRIEFFGDSIESIRQFRIADQISISTLSKVVIFPCLEIDIKHRGVKKRLEALKKRQSKRLAGWVEEDLEKISQGIYFEGFEQYLPHLYSDLGTLVDYFPSGSLLILDEAKEVEDRSFRFLSQAEELITGAVSARHLLKPPTPYYQPLKEVLSRIPRLNLTSFEPSSRSLLALKFSSKALDIIPGKLDLAKKSLRRLCKEKYSVLVVARDRGTAGRLKEIFDQWNLESQILSKDRQKLVGGKAYLVIGDLSAGFELSQLKIGVISESDIFLRRQTREELQTEKTPSFLRFSDFNQGDLVVHNKYGIAEYQGLVRERVGSAEWDCMILKYADGNVKVRTDYASRVARYIGVEQKQPKLSTLTGNRWLVAKRRARKSVKKLAINLLKLYAERQAAKGYQFSSDQVWQRELEEAFSFAETPDQLRSIKEIKQDMERAKPMDRLVCGDVGYGKTEVAVRASFKSVLDSKQVMVLAPTTILAQQHYTTFSQRLAPFPVVVEVLSRFKTPAEQKRIVEAFQAGRIDILIGTHRLLSRDVKSKNLGLLVIDEEQRFGVAHKEHLRNLKKVVDVLILSATPIPRTLQMSLAGVRDLSVIDTPPEDRYPIYTYVGEYSRRTAEMAITRELARGGQVYWVHNRVQTIEEVATKVKKMTPEARVAVAHGKMAEHRLEQVMLDFLNQEYNVLVCSTIIESGIDISTVNTIIVDGAENFGLAQLYQLRGRVGRSDQRSYAYFFYNKTRSLTATSLQRLKTISEFSDLGSGFKIAMRDLEIRGAGNLLGPEQHGNLSEVGFEFYCQLLRQEIDKLQGKPTRERKEITIDLPLRAYIPPDYIKDEQLRIEAYRDIASVGSPQEVEKVRQKLKDMYGPLPNFVQILIRVAALRSQAEKTGITGISFKKGQVLLHPVELKKKVAYSLKEKYSNLIYKPKQKTFCFTGVAQNKVLVFLETIFNDIMQLDLKH